MKLTFEYLIPLLLSYVSGLLNRFVSVLLISFVEWMSSENQIGEVKLIRDYIPTVLEFDVKALENSINIQINNLESLKEYFNNESAIEIDVSKLRLEIHKLELADAIYGIKEQENKNLYRQKRGIFGRKVTEVEDKEVELTLEDGRLIEMDLKLSKDNVIDINSETKSFVTEIEDNFIKIQKELTKLAAINRAFMFTQDVERKVNAVKKLITTGTISAEIIDASMFKEKLDEIEKSLFDNELVFNEVAEYCHHLKVKNFKLENGKIQYFLDVPVTDKSNWKLYKNKKILSGNGEQIKSDDVQWTNLAKNSEGTISIESLEQCYRTKTLFYCQ